MTARHVFILLWLAFGLGVALGVSHGRDAHRAALAELRANTAEDQRKAAQAAAKSLQEAQERGNELTLQVAAGDLRIETLTREKRDALKQTTFGRACLGTAALRVLDGAPGLRVADLPEATGGAAAADGPVATDSDIGQWALGAGAKYEQCRERLDALIKWHR